MAAYVNFAIWQPSCNNAARLRPFNRDGDRDDVGEQILVDQVVSNGANNLTAAVPAGAESGPAFARFRITSCAGHSYGGLARDGEVAEYPVTIVAAKGSTTRLRRAATFDPWAAAFVAQPSGSRTTLVGSHRQAAESD